MPGPILVIPDFALFFGSMRGYELAAPRLRPPRPSQWQGRP
ncbi:hypothetical protein NKH18_28320 [Streptomyces sp. M10(2022)]